MCLFVKSNIKLFLCILLNFLKKMQRQSDASDFKCEHSPTFIPQNSVQYFNFMAETNEQNICCPKSNLEISSCLSEILIFLEMQLRKILNYFRVSISDLVQKGLLIISGKVPSTFVRLEQRPQTLNIQISHYLLLLQWQNKHQKRSIVILLLNSRYNSLKITIIAIMSKIPKYELQPVNAPEVPKDFHLKLRTRFFQTLKTQSGQKQNFNKSACLFKGIPTVHRNYQDFDEVVNQQSTFWYLFGIKQADCYALIQNQSGKTTIFVTRLGQNLKMWMYVKSIQVFQQESLAQQVFFVDQMENYIKSLNLLEIFLYYGVDSDSSLKVELPEENYWNFVKNIDKQTLWILISNLRVIKTEDQIRLMRYVCKTSSDAHISALKSTRAGLKQIQIQSVFQFEHSTKTGSDKSAFPSICSSGRDCATLHYNQNEKIYQPGQLVLHDMGGRWYGYCADIAITFPIDGKFTKKQRQIYHAVYSAQKAVLDVLRPGVNWEDMHLLAQKVILQHLIELGIIKKFPMEELIQKRVGAVFFPHGLGHLLGLKVHDIGGYTKGQKRQKSQLAGLKCLRTRRDMEQGMVITVQPGCYFIDFIIKNALEGEDSKYFDKEKIQEYRQVGGVRLEDDVLITKNGNEVLSSLPRHWEELQKLMAQ